MLVFTFFISVFATVLWFLYSLFYINETIGDIAFSSLGMLDVATYVMIVVFPIFVIWMIFGYVNQLLTSKKVSGNMLNLFKQMKRNQEYTDLIARIMLEAEKSIKDGFVLNKFDLFIADMNELLAEIIYRCNLSSNEQIENMWKKVNNGGKWAFGKVIVEVNANQSTFTSRVFDKSQLDAVLAGTILEFTSRYLSLIALLEKHDRERVFLNILETGVFGKVFSILAPISDEIKRTREYYPPSKKAIEEERIEDTRPHSIFPQSLEINVNEDSLLSKMNPFKKKEPHLEASYDEGKDPLSIALEKSFGAGGNMEMDEPKFEISSAEEDEMPKLVMIKEEVEVSHEAPKKEAKVEPETTQTQKILDSLKQEWEDMKAYSPANEAEPKAEERPKRVNEQVDENLSYPFAGWTNEENYTK